MYDANNRWVNDYYCSFVINAYCFNEMFSFSNSLFAFMLFSPASMLTFESCMTTLAKIRLGLTLCYDFIFRFTTRPNEGKRGFDVTMAFVLSVVLFLLAGKNCIKLIFRVNMNEQKIGIYLFVTSRLFKILNYQVFNKRNCKLALYFD